jgi:hypothetical protein
LLRNAHKRDKKKSNKTTEGGEKKNGGKKTRIFCDEPRWIFSIFFRVFELPLLRNAQKNAVKKSIKIKLKLNKASNYFVFSAAANVRHFRHFFFRGPPCVANGTRTRDARCYANPGTGTQEARAEWRKIAAHTTASGVERRASAEAAAQHIASTGESWKSRRTTAHASAVK